MESQWGRKQGSDYQWWPSPSEVAEALEALYRRVQRELENCRAFAQEHEAMNLAVRAEDSLSWVATRGRETVDALRHRATVASQALRRHLVEAVLALVAVADIAMERKVPDWRKREMLLDWAEQALPMLEASVESFGESEEVYLEDWSQAGADVKTILAPETGFSRYIPVVQPCADPAYELAAA